MANIMFKRGLQTNLDTIITNKTAVDGTFYLTTDTKRLYVGKADGTAVPVNEGINKVATLTELNAITGTNTVKYGDIYYITENNILATYVGGSTPWKQINPDTDTKVEGLSIAVSAEANVATVKTTAALTGGATKDASFQIKGSDSIAVEKDATSGAVTLRATLPTSTKYTVDTDGVAIRLNNDSNGTVTTTKVEFEGAGAVTVSENAGKIKVSADDIHYDDFALAATADGFTFTAAEYKNGIITGKKVNSTISPEIQIGDTVVGFTNNVANLTTAVETKVEAMVSEELKGLNAMTYKGTLSGSQALPTANVSNGDVYLLTADRTQGVTAKSGDLVIAQGTEDTNTGYITGTITWTVVESGDEVDTTYSAAINAATKKITLTASTGGELASMTVKDLDNNPVSVAMTGASGGTAVWQVTHDSVEVNTPAATAETENAGNGEFTFTTVSNVEADEFGHVAKIETKEITVNKILPTLQKAALTVESNATNEATVTMGMGLKNGAGANYDSQEAEVAIKADATSSLTVNVDTTNNALVLGLAWGDF